MKKYITYKSILLGVYLRNEYYVGFDAMSYFNDPIIYNGKMIVIFVRNGTAYKVRKFEVFR